MHATRRGKIVKKRAQELNKFRDDGCSHVLSHQRRRVKSALLMPLLTDKRQHAHCVAARLSEASTHYEYDAAYLTQASLHSLK